MRSIKPNTIKIVNTVYKLKKNTQISVLIHTPTCSNVNYAVRTVLLISIPFVLVKHVLVNYKCKFADIQAHHYD